MISSFRGASTRRLPGFTAPWIINSGVVDQRRYRRYADLLGLVRGSVILIRLSRWFSSSKEGSHSFRRGAIASGRDKLSIHEPGFYEHLHETSGRQCAGHTVRP